MNTARFTSSQFESLRKYLFGFPRKEAAAFALAGFFTNDWGAHFTTREIMMPKPEDYDAQTSYHMQVSPIFLNRVISRAERENLAVVICHSHPWATKRLEYSSSDDYGEKASTQTLMDCLDNKPVGSLLFGTNEILGRIRKDSSSASVPIHQVRLVDRHIVFHSTQAGKRAEKNQTREGTFSRQILAFGKQVQRVLENLKIGIVGLGGIGSCIAEQLARLGIRNFTLIDRDTFELSNLTRVYGSIAGNARTHQTKVTIASRNIRKISPKVNVESIHKDVISQKVLGRLKNCDAIFSCVDRQAPRSVINEISYQYFIPVIDLGAGLDAQNGNLQGGTIRASLIGPSMPCLFCLDLLRPEIITAELLPPEERLARQREGYIRGIPTSEAASVVSFTTTAAGYAVDLFLDLFCGYIENPISNYFLDLQTFSTARISCTSKSCCVCVDRLGRADYKPLSAP